MAAKLVLRKGTTQADLSRIRGERATAETSAQAKYGVDPSTGMARKSTLRRSTDYATFKTDFDSKLYYHKYSSGLDKFANVAIVAGGVAIGGAIAGTALGAFGASGAAVPATASGAALPAVSTTLPALSTGLAPGFGGAATLLGGVKSAIAAAGAVKSAASMLKGGQASPVHRSLVSQGPQVVGGPDYTPWILGGVGGLLLLLIVTS